MPVSQKSAVVQLIADRITTLYKSTYGRGPTSVAVHVVRDAVVCILQDVNTPSQNALIRFGDADVARTMHQRLQAGMADEMRCAVEAVTGRTVLTYVPGFNAEAAATTDVFVLAPDRPDLDD